MFNFACLQVISAFIKLKSISPNIFFMLSSRSILQALYFSTLIQHFISLLMFFLFAQYVLRNYIFLVLFVKKVDLTFSLIICYLTVPLHLHQYTDNTKLIFLSIHFSNLLHSSICYGYLLSEPWCSLTCLISHEQMLNV